MSAINSIEGQSAAGGYANSNVTHDISSMTFTGWPPGSSISGSGESSVMVYARAPAAAYAINAQAARSYMDDLYYRIHVTPPILDLGNLLSSQVRTVSLWNAFLATVTVTNITETGAQGVTVTPPSSHPTTPFVLTALEETSYTLTVSLDGPPKLDAKVSWGNSEGQDVSIKIIGSRIVVFPFLPDWNAGIDETLSSRSSVLRSPNGEEQSISLREKMRRTYAFPYTLRNEQAQQAENLLFGWQSRLYGVPAWPEQAYLTAAAASGTDTLSFSTLGRSFVPGSLLLIFSGKNSVAGEVREIQSVTSSSVVLSNPLVGTWGAGSRVVPILLGAAAPQLQGVRLVPNLLQIAVLFDLEPSTTDDNAAVVPPAATYRGYEVYLGRTNWRDNLAFSSQSDVIRIDFQTGIFQLQPQSGFSSLGRSHEWFLKSMPAVSEFRSWLKRRKGKTVGVWMPSATDDFTLSGVIGAASISILVITNGYALMVNQNALRRDVYVRLKNGSYFIRRIIDSQDLGNNQTSLTLDAAFGETINPEDVLQFSFLSFYRLAGDDNVIHWHAPGKAEAVTGLIGTKAP